MKRSERGQNLVETALAIAFILLPLLVGVVDIGRVFNNYMIVANATREGTRLAARTPCYPTNAAQRAVYRQRIINAVLAEANNQGITLAAGEVTISPDPVSDGCAASTTGGALRVTVTHDFDLFVLGFGPITLSPYTEMAIYDRYPGAS